MRIQKLKILGFKSFAQKTEIQFAGNGLTAIVGPNGCGKSNIVDAIRWVMGEQRAGLLRMDKMQGVIFSGTEDRPAMNMAEVSLLIENDRGLLPSEYSEVIITRRAFANGESEYSINNQACRLADIRNLFADTGMGAGSYSQMDQRMVDALLSDKADERRTIFEEAAGVSKYKKQRKEAVSQLDRVQVDMDRVAIELQHAKNQFRQQEKMLGRAQELRKLKSRLKDLDVSLAISKYSDSKTALHNLTSQKTKDETALETLKITLTELETKIEEKKLLIAGDEDNLREREQEVSQAKTDIAKLNEAYTHQRNRHRELEESEIRCEKEIEENDARQNLLKEEISLFESETENLKPEIEELESEGERETEKLQVLRGNLDDLRANHRELSNKRHQLVQEYGKLQSSWQRADAETEMLEERINSLEKDIADLETQAKDLADLEKQSAQETIEQKKQAELSAEKIEVFSAESENLESETADLKQREIAAQSEITRLKSRLETLQSITKTAEKFEEGKFALARKTVENLSILGSQIDLTNLKYAPVIEFCLGKALEAYLEKLPITDTLQSNAAAASNEIHINMESAIPAFSVIATATPQSKESLLLKTLLSNYYIVPNFETAQELAQKYAGQNIWFCAEDCQAANAIGLIFIPSKNETSDESGILRQNAEIKNITADLQTQTALASGITSRLQSKLQKKQELAQSIANTQEEKRNAELAEFKAASSAEIAGAKKSSAIAQKEKLELELSSNKNRLLELKNARSADAELSNAEQSLAATESSFQKVESELRESEQVFKNQEEIVAELAAELNQKKSAIIQKENRLRSAKEQIQTINSAIQIRSAELGEIKGKKSQSEIELESTAEQIEKQNEILTAKETARDIARERYIVLAGDIEEWRSQVREINKNLHDKGKNEHEIELKIQSTQTNLDRIRERVFQEYEYDLENTPENQNFLPLKSEERAANVEIYELREKIKQIGPVSITVAEDFEQEKERMLSIESQYNDLSRAKNSLITAMERLDAVARDRFLDTFRKIQRNYNDIFTSLMPGGEAMLAMQGDLDPLEAEIEINARPTGKKMRGVRALSGGERALTATSLLFALYMVKPSPYCILDEIDGPLDDSNVGRFMSLLRRFSHQTQFVVITHNKRTMAASDRLYGVTQEIKGISKVGSVRLEEVGE